MNFITWIRNIKPLDALIWLSLAGVGGVILGVVYWPPITILALAAVGALEVRLHLTRAPVPVRTSSDVELEEIKETLSRVSLAVGLAPKKR